jgi:hypothetical protein
VVIHLHPFAPGKRLDAISHLRIRSTSENLQIKIRFSLEGGSKGIKIIVLIVTWFAGQLIEVAIDFLHLFAAFNRVESVSDEPVTPQIRTRGRETFIQSG